jgi:hypothetical protein
MPDDTNDYKGKLHEAYSAERKDINETALKISERYDKNILFIGAGSLAVSLTFLEKISPDPSPKLLYIWFFADYCGRSSSFPQWNNIATR